MGKGKKLVGKKSLNSEESERLSARFPHQFETKWWFKQRIRDSQSARLRKVRRKCAESAAVRRKSPGICTFFCLISGGTPLFLFVPAITSQTFIPVPFPGSQGGSKFYRRRFPLFCPRFRRLRNPIQEPWLIGNFSASDFSYLGSEGPLTNLQHSYRCRSDSWEKRENIVKTRSTSTFPIQARVFPLGHSSPRSAIRGL